MAKALVECGHDVTILIPPKGYSEYKTSRYEVDGVKFKRVLGHWLGRISGPSLSAIFLAENALAERPDVIHVFRPAGRSGVAGIFLKKFTNIPVIVDVDEWEGSGGLADLAWFIWRPFHDYQERRLVAMADAVTVSTQNLQKRMIDQLGARRDGVYYVPEGPLVSPDEVEKAEDKLQPPAITFLGYAPSVYHDLDILSETASIMRRNGSNGHNGRFRVVGNGPGLDELNKCVTEKGLQDIFQIVNNDDPNAKYSAAEVLASASILVFPCRSNRIREMKAAAPVITYMSAGKPIVAGDVGPIPTYLEGGNAGILVEVGEEDDVKALGQLYADGVRKAMTAGAYNLGLRARELVRSYIWTKERGMKTVQIYRHAAERLSKSSDSKYSNAFDASRIAGFLVVAGVVALLLAIGLSSRPFVSAMLVSVGVILILLREYWEWRIKGEFAVHPTFAILLIALILLHLIADLLVAVLRLLS